MSEPGADPSSGISSGDALILPERHPAAAPARAAKAPSVELQALPIVRVRYGQSAPRKNDR
jgi:hypothetical protein